MRKILCVLVIILGVTNLFAQRQSDLKISLLSPDSGHVFHPGDSMKIKIEFKNLGAASWVVGDSIAWEANFLPSLYLLKATRTVPTGDTLLLNLTSTGLVFDTSYTTDICVGAAFFNVVGPNQLVDPDSSNNISCTSITLQGNNPVAINDVNAPVKALKVYPNPASNEIIFSHNGFTNNAFNVQIVDITGRVIISKSYGQNSNKKINIENLTSGIYQIRVSQDEQKYIGKFAKQ